ncbi:hypothetical protein [Phenylobacterium sp.]|uniref:hypothetical protein n=1 Tax=Phenylobacterium sp. TaxID=1871053 RepID=UPI00273676B1|nr:hypothetical protein [Phenylobacterium sp.]MDP3853168.1 hypothetical protein [Phenylobacterium sp.]
MGEMASGYRNAVAIAVRKGELTAEELALAAAWRAQRMSWGAVARALGRSEPDVRRECDAAWATR